MQRARDSKVVAPQIPKRTDSENKYIHASKEAPDSDAGGFLYGVAPVNPPCMSVLTTNTTTAHSAVYGLTFLSSTINDEFINFGKAIHADEEDPEPPSLTQGLFRKGKAPLSYIAHFKIFS